ncbi:hypothetical protein MMSP_2299 [Mycobacterium sp. 012931]|nr:hypothetical protein MMSP_2299 [Mycobacterium sp. 012931]
MRSVTGGHHLLIPRVAANGEPADPSPPRPKVIPNQHRMV